MNLDTQDHSNPSLDGEAAENTDFDVVEVFEDELQLNEWLANRGDWIIECNRNTKTHQITEMVCRLSYEGSHKHMPDTPYNCQARLRIRRPLPERSEMDQSVIVEKTAADHDHEPMKTGSKVSNEDLPIISASEENGKESARESISPNLKVEKNEEGGGQIEESNEANVSSIFHQNTEVLDKEEATDQKVNEYTQELGKEVQQESLDMNELVSEKGEEIADEEVIQEEQKEEVEEERFMIEKPVEELGPAELETSDQKTTDQEGSSERTKSVAENLEQPLTDEHLLSSSTLSIVKRYEQSSSRPKRNRTRRLYSPSPPPRLGGEPKRKKEKSEESIKEKSTTPSSLQNLLVGRKIPWAKEQPTQSHLPQSPVSSSASNNSTVSKEKTLPSAPTNLSSSSTSMIRIIPPVSTLANVNLQRQNEKLMRENMQLKHLNQEQQQQIQALISANRELIWAFNESRREHGELMKQLRLLTNGKVNGETPNVDSPAIASQSKPSAKIGVNKRTSSGRGRNRDILMMSPDALPPSLAILNKKQQQSSSPMVSQKSTDRTRIVGEQLTTALKKEVDKRALEVSTASGTGTRKLTREEKIEKIKQQLEKQQSSESDMNKLLGTRKPAFFTPTEFGDWHSVVSGGLRKNLVLQIFQALCPEINQNIEEYTKTYPSRADYFKKSVDFSFNTENEVFVGSSARDEYFRTLADKIFTLRESVTRFAPSTSKRKSADEGDKRHIVQPKRTLADVLKPKKSKQTSDEEDMIMDEGPD